ncbi:MAG: hypothetical protein BWY82_00754 [Verrucomicrobia bacterium ADurb.Bin474]|nr:MAG: hypothetical protein BWY82_00754 [Verrucomicrobia bacterium ADurb.Bin474]
MKHILIAILVFCVTIVSANDYAIPVSVHAQAEMALFKSGHPLPISLTVSNGLSATLRFTTFSTSPNDWNGETMNISLVEVYRDGKRRNLLLNKPELSAPSTVSGPASHPIHSNATLTIMIDANKWTIDGGWAPGQYELVFRLEKMTIDGRSELSVVSDPPLKVLIQ